MSSSIFYPGFTFKFIPFTFTYQLRILLDSFCAEGKRIFCPLSTAHTARRRQLQEKYLHKSPMRCIEGSDINFQGRLSDNHNGIAFFFHNY